MSKRQPKPAASAGKRADPAAALRKALAQRTKAELIDLLSNLARENRGILRHLTARFEVAATSKELVAATRQAIADATDFDEREINRNFRYDYEAYNRVKRAAIHHGRPPHDRCRAGRPARGCRPQDPLALRSMKPPRQRLTIA